MIVLKRLKNNNISHWIVTFQLTSQKPRMLLVYLEDYGGNSKFAVYDNFEVGSESEKYILKNALRLYGTLDDSLVVHKDSTFTTRDVDYSLCVEKYFGAWWNSKKCYYRYVCMVIILILNLY